MQLLDDITEDDFDLGHVQCKYKYCEKQSRSTWEGLTEGLNIILWCDGLPLEQTSSRKRLVSAVEPDAEDSKEKKGRRKMICPRKKVGRNLAELQANNGKGFTTMQYRIWAEMHAGGYHPSLPTNSKQHQRQEVLWTLCLKP